MPVTFIKKPGAAATSPVVTAPKIAIAQRQFNPLLAAEGVLGKINYGKSGLVLMPKHNGVRGANQCGNLVARSLKPIPNAFTRSLFSGQSFVDLEGELVVGDPFDEEVFSNSTSGVMSRDGTPEVTWYLFDMFMARTPFIERLMAVHERARVMNDPLVQAIPFQMIQSDEELVMLSDHYLSMGFEGVVLKDPDGLYKEGRSTAKEQLFMRYCPWLRSEALILSIHEGQINQNVSKRNELGYLRKSSHKENMVGSGQAGSVYVRDLKTNIEFSMLVPTDALQKYMWANKPLFLNHLVKYKHKPAVIKGGKPRFPQWEGLRHEDDVS